MITAIDLQMKFRGLVVIVHPIQLDVLQLIGVSLHGNQPQQSPRLKGMQTTILPNRAQAVTPTLGMVIMKVWKGSLLDMQKAVAAADDLLGGVWNENNKAANKGKEDVQRGAGDIDDDAFTLRGTTAVVLAHNYSATGHVDDFLADWGDLLANDSTSTTAQIVGKAACGAAHRTL